VQERLTSSGQTVAAALKVLCQDLLVELEKPLDETLPPPEPSAEDLCCRVTIREYHAFLGATVKFLHAVQERQMVWNWSAESPVFHGVTWLQGLWASRKAVSSNIFWMYCFVQLDLYWGYSKGAWGEVC
jgi:hypothetical protein